jgi:hypothetical protein
MKVVPELSLALFKLEMDYIFEHGETNLRYLSYEKYQLE